MNALRIPPGNKNLWKAIATIDEIANSNGDSGDSNNSSNSGDSDTSSDDSDIISKSFLEENWLEITPDVLMNIYIDNDESESYIDTLSTILQLATEAKEVDTFVKLLLSFGFLAHVQRMIEALDDYALCNPSFCKSLKLLHFLVSCSYRSEEMCRALINKKFHKTVVKKLDSWSNILQDLDKSSKYEGLSEFCDSWLIITFNTVRKFPESKQGFRDDGVITLSLLLLQAKDSLLKANALLALTFVADISSDTKVITATSSNIQFILESLLRTALNSPGHYSGNNEQNYSGMNCTVEEIMEVLSILSKNEDNAKEMVNFGILDDCEKLFEDSLKKEELLLSLSVIWSVSFQVDLQDRLRKRNIVAKIQEWKSDDCQEIRQAVAGIEWNMQEHQSTKCGASAVQDGKKHIMISYCHKQQALVWQIWARLKQRGVNIWIDKTKMQGDMYDKMAKGVQNASHVICCVSEDYFNSDACRSEAQYSKELKRDMIFVKIQQNYRPEDWLGLIMAGKIYYEMHNADEIEKKIDMVLAYVEGKEEIVPQLADRLEATDGTNTKKGKELFKSWSKDEVREWYDSIGCSTNETALQILQEIDGRLLCQLYNWQQNAPQFFLKFSQEKLQFPAIDLIKFSSAVEQLATK